MKLESKIEIVGGSLMLLSIALAHWVDERWLLLAVFVGFNLIQSPITGFCATGALLKALGFGDSDPGTPPRPPKVDR